MSTDVYAFHTFINRLQHEQQAQRRFQEQIRRKELAEVQARNTERIRQMRARDAALAADFLPHPDRDLGEKKPKRTKYSAEEYLTDLSRSYWELVEKTGEAPEVLDVINNLTKSISLSPHYRYVKQWNIPDPPPKP